MRRARSRHRCTATTAKTSTSSSSRGAWALLGDDVVEASPGDLVYTPRGQWHTFATPAMSRRGSEIICPAGFEKFFAEPAPLSSGGAPDPEAFGEPAAATRSTCGPRACRSPARASRSGSRGHGVRRPERDESGPGGSFTVPCSPANDAMPRCRNGSTRGD